MKKLIAIAAMAVCLPAAAEEDRNLKCAHVAQVFNFASIVRDGGYPPEVALKNTAMVDIPEAERKRYVNLVYFDPAFTVISSRSMEHYAFAACMHVDGPKFQPLK